MSRSTTLRIGTKISYISCGNVAVWLSPSSAKLRSSLNMARNNPCWRVSFSNRWNVCLMALINLFKDCAPSLAESSASSSRNGSWAVFRSASKRPCLFLKCQWTAPRLTPARAAISSKLTLSYPLSRNISSAARRIWQFVSAACCFVRLKAFPTDIFCTYVLLFWNVPVTQIVKRTERIMARIANNSAIVNNRGIVKFVSLGGFLHSLYFLPIEKPVNQHKEHGYEHDCQQGTCDRAEERCKTDRLTRARACTTRHNERHDA